MTVINEALEAIMERPLEDLLGTDKLTLYMVSMAARVRQDVLRRQDWTCARARVPLVEITYEPWTSEVIIDDGGDENTPDPAPPVINTEDENTPDPAPPVINYTGYDHVFQAPAALRLIDVVDPAGFEPVDRLLEGDRIYTDEPEPIAIITQDLEDPTAWDSLLRSAIVYSLAARTVFNITGQQDKVQMLMQVAEGYYSEAKRQSLREHEPGPEPSSEWFPDLWTRTP